MSWIVLEHPDFTEERRQLAVPVQDKLAEVILALQVAGPRLGRPLVDTLKGSSYARMKEIRLNVQGAWRFAFAFDEERQAILLVGANKEGQSQKLFYRRLIDTADKRFKDWLDVEES